MGENTKQNQTVLLNKIIQMGQLRLRRAGFSLIYGDVHYKTLQSVIESGWVGEVTPPDSRSACFQLTVEGYRHLGISPFKQGKSHE